MKVPPPQSIEELLHRVSALRGVTLAEVAEAHHMRVPDDLRRHKGWIGDLAEVALGADAGSIAEPDFSGIGVELKTVPLDARGVPRESTWVCVAPFDGSGGRTWASSWVRRKLSRVLWLPVHTLPDVPVSERTFGDAVLWAPDAAQDAQLRADWESLSEALWGGELWRTAANHGEWLQLRPKAMDGAAGEWVQDADANWVRAMPMGFYLRARFTRTLLAPQSPRRAPRGSPPGRAPA